MLKQLLLLLLFKILFFVLLKILMFCFFLFIGIIRIKIDITKAKTPPNLDGIERKIT